ncbi:MAG TPA: sugar ABC transporter permease [Candidatus Atribacteria bacterium]|nr:sugar ABC transporter permease [Candidatus Atribacteria bacterium]
MSKLKHRFLPYLFILPSILILVPVIIYPLGFSLYNSFQHWNLQISPVSQGFVGFTNYINTFKDLTFTQSFINTFKLSVPVVIIEFVIGLGIALLFNENIKGGNIFRAMLIMPITIAPMITGFLFRYLYYKNGLISYLLLLIGVQIPKEGILGNPITAFWGIAFTDIWQWTPFFAIILFAGLQSISVEIIEAAQIDGASFFRLFWYITLPNLKFVILITVMIRFMQTFNLFDIIQAETMGGPGTATRTLSYNLYYEGLVNYNIGYSLAIAWIMIFTIMIIINIFVNFTLKKEEL